MEVDEALSRLGTWGRWQVVYFLMLSTACMFPACWQMLAINFIGISHRRRYKERGAGGEEQFAPPLEF